MEWQPIETAPKDGSWVVILVYEESADWCKDDYPNGVPYAEVSRYADEGYWQSDSIYSPTYWMPLPAAPEEK